MQEKYCSMMLSVENLSEKSTSPEVVNLLLKYYFVTY